MVALDVVIAELEQYARRSQRIIRGLRQFHSEATGHVAGELTTVLREYTIFCGAAEDALRALTLLRASSFPQPPRFPITQATQQFLTQLRCDMQEGQEQLDLMKEATVGEIVQID